MSASKGSSRATAALCRAGNSGREMSGSSWSIPVSAGGDLGSERAGADGASGHHCRAAHAIPGFAGKKKKINNVFWCFVTLPGDVPLLGARRDARHRGNAAATPLRDIRAVPCPPLHLRVADKAAGRASVKGTDPRTDISPEKPHRSEKPGSSQRRTGGGDSVKGTELGGGGGGSPGGTPPAEPQPFRAAAPSWHTEDVFSTPNSALLLPRPNNTSRGCEREQASGRWDTFN